MQCHVCLHKIDYPKEEVFKCALKVELTQEGEPGKEGGRAEVEEGEEQQDEVERDGVSLTPPVVKHSCRAVSAPHQQDTSIATMFGVRKWTYNCWEGEYLRLIKPTLKSVYLQYTDQL